MNLSQHKEAAGRTLLVEIGCEEIPARFLAQAQKDFGEQLAAALREARLEAGPASESLAMRTFSTPRRLVACASGLRDRQPDQVEETIGPPVAVALDREGQPTRAAASFAAKNQARVDDLYRLTTPKGEYLALRKTVPGRPALDVLAGLLPRVITRLSFPKSMYWEATKTRWVRPIRWILALFGAAEAASVIPLEVAGVRSGRLTFGHRTLGPGPVEVAHFEDYAGKLRQRGVEFDPAKRQARVRADIQALLEGTGWTVVPDPGLEDWIVYSTEWPVAIMGAFEEQFLKLPREILITVMRDHQKYFAVENSSGRLQPKFITVLNVANDARGIIRCGHERVLTARFTDAEFFWNADQKIPLRDRLPMLERVTYHEKLGTYADKVRRLDSLAREICRTLEEQGRMTRQDTLYVLRAAQLCKCDLTTQMVREFTELQGVVGGLYAAEQGEPEAVWQAIYDHYRPQTAEERCPRCLAGAVVSLADKLDSVVSGFAAGLEPTGSSDPFGLRRAGNGVVKLAVESLVGLSLGKAAHQAVECAQQTLSGLAGRALGSRVDSFLRERAEFYFREVAGLRYDTVRAVLSPAVQAEFDAFVPSSDLARAQALEQIRDTEDFLALTAAAKRTRNILAKSARPEDLEGGPEEVDPARFREPAERDLYAAYRRLLQSLEELGRHQRYAEAFREMARIRPQVDGFFDRVLVMAEDDAVRRNRLRLLIRLNQDVFTRLADLTEITGEARGGAAGGSPRWAGRSDFK